MKHSLGFKLYIIIVLGLSTLFSLSSQKSTQQMNKVSLSLIPKFSNTDTVPLVEYMHKDKVAKRTESLKSAFYINDVLVKEHCIATISPDQIESVEVVKDSLTMKDKTHNGEIYITMKEPYRPAFLSLNALKMKYVDAKYKSTLFMIDNKIIDEDYDSYLVDEKYIMKIEVEFIQNEKERLGINIIHLITRSEENMKKANNILIRGSAF